MRAVFAGLFTLASIFSPLLFAEEMHCAQSQGAVVYDSLTKYPNQVLIVHPRILVDHETRLIGTWTGDMARRVAGNGLCRALGYKGGLVGDVSPWMEDTAQKPKVALDENGKILDYKRSIDYFIENVVCDF